MSWRFSSENPTRFSGALKLRSDLSLRPLLPARQPIRCGNSLTRDPKAAASGNGCITSIFTIATFPAFAARRCTFSKSASTAAAALRCGGLFRTARSHLRC